MIKKILIPVDGSESADKACSYGLEIASGVGAEVVFLYVSNINQLAINACLTEALMKAVEEAGTEIINRAVSLAPEGVKVEGVTVSGSPAVVIIEQAEALKADMIVMGSRGLGMFKGALLGSVSQYVVEQANCPVVVVKGEAEK